MTTAHAHGLILGLFSEYRSRSKSETARLGRDASPCPWAVLKAWG